MFKRFGLKGSIGSIRSKGGKFSLCALCSFASFARNKKVQVQKFGDFRLPMLVFSLIFKVREV
jgi:hypothetical protein